MKHKTEDYKIASVKYYLKNNAVRAVVVYGTETEMVHQISTK